MVSQAVQAGHADQIDKLRFFVGAGGRRPKPRIAEAQKVVIWGRDKAGATHKWCSA